MLSMDQISVWIETVRCLYKGSQSGLLIKPCYKHGPQKRDRYDVNVEIVWYKWKLNKLINQMFY